MKPEKLEIPSSGHLEVQLENPTDNLIEIGFTMDSFSFKFERAWILKDGKEIDVMNDEKQNRLIHGLEGHDVLHFRIKCRKAFKHRKWETYEKSSEFGYFKITWEVKINSLHPSRKANLTKEFHMNAFKTFPLSIEPNCEKAKVLAEAFLEQQKHQERRQRIKDCHTKEESVWLDVTEDYISYEWDRKTKMNMWIEEILEKYGAKIDQLSDNEIKKMKEDLMKSFEKERKKKENEIEKGIKEEKEENEARRQQEMRLKKEQEKKCVVM
uniref:MATH domain-containing protein n=1 Tax=Caenorhabditis tropicalis TaxID=1561998 RepID=A0A1I7UPJ5_9PELO